MFRAALWTSGASVVLAASKAGAQYLGSQGAGQRAVRTGGQDRRQEKGARCSASTAADSRPGMTAGSAAARWTSSAADRVRRTRSQADLGERAGRSRSRPER
jgi:hypothetical protein